MFNLPALDGKITEVVHGEKKPIKAEGIEEKKIEKESSFEQEFQAALDGSLFFQPVSDPLDHQGGDGGISVQEPILQEPTLVEATDEEVLLKAESPIFNLVKVSPEATAENVEVLGDTFKLRKDHQPLMGKNTENIDLPQFSSVKVNPPESSLSAVAELEPLEEPQIGLNQFKDNKILESVDLVDSVVPGALKSPLIKNMTQEAGVSEVSSEKLDLTGFQKEMSSENFDFSEQFNSQGEEPTFSSGDRDELRVEGESVSIESTQGQSFSSLVSNKKVELLSTLDGMEGLEPVMENVEKMIDQSSTLIKEGGGEMRVRLNPEGLGEVSLKVSLQEGQVKVQILTETSLAKDVLERGLDDLKLGLETQQLKVDEIRVTASKESSQSFLSDQEGRFQNPYNWSGENDSSSFKDSQPSQEVDFAGEGVEEVSVQGVSSKIPKNRLQGQSGQNLNLVG